VAVSMRFAQGIDLICARLWPRWKKSENIARRVIIATFPMEGWRKGGHP